MDWNRTNTIGLAKASCAQCHGYGLRFIRFGREVPCHCVYRAVFRACYSRFRDCVNREKNMSTVTLEFCRGGRDRRRSYSRRTEEYLADFLLVSRRVLDDPEHRMFRRHFLLGADWKLCCRMMNLDRGSFFHEIYRIEQKLGKAFAELEPYALYPVDEYFGGAIRKEGVRATLMELPVASGRKRWQAPLARPA